jgi:hypothetical protein
MPTEVTMTNKAVGSAPDVTIEKTISKFIGNPQASIPSESAGTGELVTSFPSDKPPPTEKQSPVKKNPSALARILSEAQSESSLKPVISAPVVMEPVFAREPSLLSHNHPLVLTQPQLPPKAQLTIATLPT